VLRAKFWLENTPLAKPWSVVYLEDAVYVRHQLHAGAGSGRKRGSRCGRHGFLLRQTV
jgi:hypothetical protein